jgi:hypothetical protein
VNAACWDAHVNHVVCKGHDVLQDSCLQDWIFMAWELKKVMFILRSVMWPDQHTKRRIKMLYA